MPKQEDRRQRPARAGDGTLPEKNDRPDINWFGSSKRPVEEFADDHHPDAGGVAPRNPGYGESGGESGGGSAENRERNETRERDAGGASADVFPSGGPEAQSDG